MDRETQTTPFRKRLRHGVAWAAGSQGAAMLAQAGIVILLAKFGSASVLGRYALAVSIVAPITLLTRLQLRGVVTTDVKPEYRFGEYLALQLVTNCVALAGVLVVLAVLRPGWDDGATVLALTLVKLIDNTSAVFLGRLQRSDQWRRIATASTAKAGVGLAAFAFTWTSSGTLPLALVAVAVAEILVLVLYEMPTVRREVASVKPVWEGGKIVDLALAALPMGGVAALVSLIFQIPRYFLEAFEGTEALGHWAAVMQVTTATALALQPAGQASLARLAAYDLSNPVAFRRLFSLLLGAAGLLGDRMRRRSLRHRRDGLVCALSTRVRCLTAHSGSDHGGGHRRSYQLRPRLHPDGGPPVSRSAPAIRTHDRGERGCLLPPHSHVWLDRRRLRAHRYLATRLLGRGGRFHLAPPSENERPWRPRKADGCQGPSVSRRRLGPPIP